MTSFDQFSTTRRPARFCVKWEDVYLLICCNNSWHEKGYKTWLFSSKSSSKPLYSTYNPVGWNSQTLCSEHLQQKYKWKQTTCLVNGSKFHNVFFQPLTLRIAQKPHAPSSIINEKTILKLVFWLEEPPTRTPTIPSLKIKAEKHIAMSTFQITWIEVDWWLIKVSRSGLMVIRHLQASMFCIGINIRFWCMELLEKQRIFFGWGCTVCSILHPHDYRPL